MISRLSTFATVFAIAGTAALAFTVQAQQRPQAAITPIATQARPVRIIELPRVVVVARRLERSAR